MIIFEYWYLNLILIKYPSMGFCKASFYCSQFLYRLAIIIISLLLLLLTVSTFAFIFKIYGHPQSCLPSMTFRNKSGLAAAMIKQLNGSTKHLKTLVSQHSNAAHPEIYLPKCPPMSPLLGEPAFLKQLFRSSYKQRFWNIFKLAGHIFLSESINLGMNWKRNYLRVWNNQVDDIIRPTAGHLIEWPSSFRINQKMKHFWKFFYNICILFFSDNR